MLKPSGGAGGVQGVGVLWTPSCWCACTHTGEDQWDVAVVSPSPDPAAPWFSVTDSSLGRACLVGQLAVPGVRDFLGKPGVCLYVIKDNSENAALVSQEQR